MLVVVGAAALAFGEGAPTTGSRGTDASHVGGWRFGVVRFRCVLLVAYLLENFFKKTGAKAMEMGTLSSFLMGVYFVLG